MAAAKIIDILARNKAIALPMAPPSIAQIRQKMRSVPGRNGLVIISCSDPRVVPDHFLGLQKNEAAIIRNAGGRTSDSVRTILTLDTIVPIGTIMVIHHTDCGTSLVLDEEIRGILRKRLVGKEDLLKEVDHMHFGEIVDVNASIKEDIAFLKASPLLDPEINILGFNLDTHTGLLTEVKEDASEFQ